MENIFLSYFFVRHLSELAIHSKSIHLLINSGSMYLGILLSLPLFSIFFRLSSVVRKNTATSLKLIRFISSLTFYGVLYAILIQTYLISLYIFSRSYTTYTSAKTLSAEMDINNYWLTFATGCAFLLAIFASKLVSSVIEPWLSDKFTVQKDHNNSFSDIRTQDIPIIKKFNLQKEISKALKDKSIFFVCLMKNLSR